MVADDDAERADQPAGQQSIASLNSVNQRKALPRFRGEARADTGAEGALNNLLNVIGRRQGAISLLSIG